MEQTKSFAALLNGASPVTVVANENIDGNPIITPLMNPDNTPKTDLNGNELGSIRLQQRTSSLNGGSFLNVRNRVAFIGGTLANLEAIVAAAGLKDGSQVAGKIFVTESLAPFWPNQNPKINPQTEETIEMTVGDKKYPVYMRMLFTENLEAKDRFIRTPEDAIEWLNAHKVEKALNAVVTPETAGMPQA
jgi:hypothetical protein